MQEVSNTAFTINNNKRLNELFQAELSKVANASNAILKAKDYKPTTESVADALKRVNDERLKKTGELSAPVQKEFHETYDSFLKTDKDLSKPEARLQHEIRRLFAIEGKPIDAIDRLKIDGIVGAQTTKGLEFAAISIAIQKGGIQPPASLLSLLQDIKEDAGRLRTQPVMPTTFGMPKTKEREGSFIQLNHATNGVNSFPAAKMPDGMVDSFRKRIINTDMPTTFGMPKKAREDGDGE